MDSGRRKHIGQLTTPPLFDCCSRALSPLEDKQLRGGGHLGSDRKGTEITEPESLLVTYFRTVRLRESSLRRFESQGLKQFSFRDTAEVGDAFHK